MTTDFASGSIPSQYREIYETCSFNGEPIHRDVYQCLMAQCKISTIQLKTIWDLIKPTDLVVNRTHFYKTLALIAWAQQGRQLSDKLFDSCTGRDYPIPIFDDLTPVKNLKMKLNVTEKLCAGFNYKDLEQLDEIALDIVPEKKGLFLKYTEYAVKSRRFNRSVTRRYNDFVALQDLLINRFPYRLVPSLPPKKIVSDANFLEARRRALHRWLTLVSRHPTIGQDALVAFFLTDQGQDLQYRIRDIYRRAPDEFMTSDIAGNAKDLLPADYTQIASNREQIRNLVHILSKLHHLTELSIERQRMQARDSDVLSEQLKLLSSFQINGSWSGMRGGFALMARNLKPLPIRADLQADRHQGLVGEQLALLLDILVAHKVLCERLEKGLAQDHQQALSKMLSLKKRKIQGVIRGADADSVEQLEAKMLTQENVISNMELRSDFSLYCVHMETLLVYAYLETLPNVLEQLVVLNVDTHREMMEIWRQVQPNANGTIS